MGKYENVSTIGLIAKFAGLAKKFISQEKVFVKQVAQDTARIAIPGVVLALAGLIFIALAGILSLFTAVEILNIWLQPWASALIVTSFFMIMGVILAVAGLIMLKKGTKDAKTNLNQVKEDIKWLKKS